MHIPSIHSELDSGKPISSKSWADRFLTEYDEHRHINADRRRRQRQQRRAKAAGKHKPVDQKDFIFRHQETQELVRERMDKGFRWHGGCFSGDYRRPAFTYEGLKSDEHPILKMFVSKVHRKHKLSSGWEKDVVVPSRSKLLSLDDAYVPVNGDMRAIIRVELDSIWNSTDELRMAIWSCLYEHAGDPAAVAMPNIIVGYENAECQWLRPHLIWIIENSVCWTDNARLAPKLKFRKLLTGLTLALADIGADLGGLTNSLKMKNPLSPLWDTRIVAEEPYQMEQIAVSIDMQATPHTIRQRIRKTGPDIEIDGRSTPSNQFFAMMQAWAFENVPEFKAAGATLDEFQIAAISHAIAISGNRKEERQAKAVAYRVAAWIWTAWKPNAKQKPRPQRGRIMDQIEGMDLAGRQAAGARDVHDRRRDSTRQAVEAAYRKLMQSSNWPSQKDVSLESGVSTRVIKRIWNDVVLTCQQSAVWCIDKKEAFSTADSSSLQPGTHSTLHGDCTVEPASKRPCEDRSAHRSIKEQGQARDEGTKEGRPSRGAGGASSPDAAEGLPPWLLQ